MKSTGTCIENHIALLGGQGMVVIQNEEALAFVNEQHVLICGGGAGSNAEATDEAAYE